MTPEQFCYWLQGRAELVQQTPTDAEWKSIVEHLETVFEKVTPPVERKQQKFDPRIPRRICSIMEPIEAIEAIPSIYC